MKKGLYLECIKNFYSHKKPTTAIFKLYKGLEDKFFKKYTNGQ